MVGTGSYTGIVFVEEESGFHFEPRKLLNFDFNADPTFHSKADPNTASKNNADPDPKHCLHGSVCMWIQICMAVIQILGEDSAIFGPYFINIVGYVTSL